MPNIKKMHCNTKNITDRPTLPTGARLRRVPILI